MLDEWESRVSSLRRVSFDSNALIYYLEAVEPYGSYVARIIAAMDSGQVTGLISTVAEMEVLVKPMRKGTRRDGTSWRFSFVRLPTWQFALWTGSLPGEPPTFAPRHACRPWTPSSWPPPWKSVVTQ
jgi:hypothetical protein